MVLLIFRSWLLTLQRESLNVPIQETFHVNIDPVQRTNSCTAACATSLHLLPLIKLHLTMDDKEKLETGGFSSQRRCLTKCSWNLSEISSFGGVENFVFCSLHVLHLTEASSDPVQTDSLPLAYSNSVPPARNEIHWQFLLLLSLFHWHSFDDSDVTVSTNLWIFFFFLYILKIDLKINWNCHRISNMITDTRIWSPSPKYLYINPLTWLPKPGSLAEFH
jgi:hypothetical protein